MSSIRHIFIIMVHRLYYIRDRKMAKAKSYIEARDLLFKRLLQFAIIAVGITCLLNFYFGNYVELYISFSFLFLVSLSWIVFKLGPKKISYHIIVWSFVLSLCYPIFYLGNSYQAIIIYPVAALTFNFVFFESKRVLWTYFGLFLIIEFFLLVSTMKLELTNLHGQFFVEYLNILTYMTCLFAIGHFFISNLRKQQKELSIAKADIEEKKKELGQKNKTLDKYIESNIQLESFAHLAAHELKAPLRSISGFAGLLRKKVKDKLTPEEDDMFKVIAASNRQMHDMIGALNQLGSVSKMELNPSEFEIHKLIEEIKFDRKEEIKESKAVLEIDIESPLLVADRTLLKQLLSNLIGNAFKFMKEGETPKVKISVKQKEQEFIIRIDDNGIGVKAEDRERIFTLFERLNSSSSYSGSGIGLAICKKIVQLHKGRIWVESLSPQGSGFVFTIPI